MHFLTPTAPLHDPVTWAQASFQERVRLSCLTWAMQGYGTPGMIFVLYGVKVLLFIAGWVGFCSVTPGLGGFSTIGEWWLQPIAFQKAILWSLLFEVMGLGCGSGPLTGRYKPPFGGFLYFLRPGTTKLPLFPGAPIIGRPLRSALDAALYAALLASSVRALLAPTLTLDELLPIVILVPVLGVLDKTVFLAARGEHYWVATVVFAFAQPWLAGAKAIQLALWFWAGVSKLNHHFPTVVCAMTSNSPYVGSQAFLRRMYKDYPNDLRPSRLAEVLAHVGTVLEFSVPIAFLLTPLGTPPVVAMLLMLMLHGYITSNIPMGVPIEWNFTVVYSAFALFWAHPDVSLLELGPPWIVAFLLFTLVALPLFGNFVPERLSFLLSMRYYAGNWPLSVWLFRGQAHKKLEKLRGSTPWISDQLAGSYDELTINQLLGRGLAFRVMHLPGRVFMRALPKTVDNVDEYQWTDGEVIAGMVIGYNFGDGHLHQQQLLESVQAQCGFEPGELRCIFVESQPLFKGTIDYRIFDASTGQLHAERVQVSELRERQPWQMG